MPKRLILFGLGGLGYMITELLWRGKTHWSMFILGGVCFVLIGITNEKLRLPLVLRMFCGAVIITVCEFIMGYIVNIILGIEVWSYRHLPYNVMGQICLPYTLLWFAVSWLCIIADESLKRYFFDKNSESCER